MRDGRSPILILKRRWEAQGITGTSSAAVRAQLEERAQAPLSHDRPGQRIAARRQRFDDLGCEIKEARDLGRMGTRHAELAG